MRLAPINQADPVNWSHPLNQGLEAWYYAHPGIIDNGPLLYDVAKGYDGALGTGNAWTAGPAGNGTSLVLSGSNSWINLPTILPLTGGANRTVSCWLYADIGNDNYIFSSGTIGNGNYFAVKANHGLGYLSFMGYNSDVISNAGSLNLSKWQHIVVSYSGNGAVPSTTNLFLYVDAQYAGFNGTPGSAINTGAAGFAIGWLRPQGIKPFTGKIADFRLYARAFSESEVLGLYNESLAGYPMMLNRLDSPITRFGPQGGPFPWYLDSSAMSGGLQTMGL